MAVDSLDLAGKLCRGIRALIVSAGAGTNLNTFVAPGSATKTLPNTTIEAETETAFEDEVGTGNYRFPAVRVIFRDPGANQPADDDVDAERVAAGLRMGPVIESLISSNDGTTLNYTAVAITQAGQALAVSSPADNADMANFTVLFWKLCDLGTMRRVRHVKKATCWERILLFECVCCNSAIAA